LNRGLARSGARYAREFAERRRGGRGGQTWATFLSHQAHETWACDFLAVVALGFRSLFAYFIVERGSRRVADAGVTRRPTDAWAAQQLREATPFGPPRTASAV
jgi:hypothetical protein